jgi:hypothetical protein
MCSISQDITAVSLGLAYGTDDAAETNEHDTPVNLVDRQAGDSEGA